MENTPVKLVGAVLSGIVGVAILGVIVSRNSATASVISSAFGGFARVLGVAVSPVTGGRAAFNSTGANTSTNASIGGYSVSSGQYYAGGYGSNARNGFGGAVANSGANFGGAVIDGFLNRGANVIGKIGGQAIESGASALWNNISGGSGVDPGLTQSDFTDDFSLIEVG